MNPIARNAALAALAAALLWAPAGAGAQAPAAGQEARQGPAARLEAYRVAIATADPAAAAAYLEDAEAQALAGAGAMALQASAAALKDLRDLLSMAWDPADFNRLGAALALRTGAGKPLAALGLGPAPEPLLPWYDRHLPRAAAAKRDTIKKAIRHWDVVFGTTAVSQATDWDQAQISNNMGVSFSRADWETWGINERSAAISKMSRQAPMLMAYDDARVDGLQREMAAQRALTEIKNSGALSQPQLDQLAGKSFQDQLYLLGNMFDGSNIQVAPELKVRVQAARDSLPREVLPAQQRGLLGGMLAAAMPGEFRGTSSGDRVLEFYAKNGPLKIEIRPCDGAYSRFDEATGTIVLDSETIQQYMRMKGYTADSVMRSREQVAEIAKYMSPMVVYEAAHHMQSAWAKSSGVYKPRVQEDEIEAMSLEGLYSNEKLARDPAYRAMLDSAGAVAPYAEKRLEVATEFNASGAKKFANTVRSRYFSGLPSLDAAAAQVLAAAAGELARREGLTQGQRDEIEASGIGLEEALEMQPDEFCGTVEEIRSGALRKISGDLASRGVYRERYKKSDNATRDGLKALQTARVPAPQKAVPDL
jgi:hypothetical protein